MDRLDALLIPALDGVSYGLLLFVVSAGLALCFGVADILNLAHGTCYAFGAYAGAALGDGTWIGLGAAIGLGCLAGAAGGGLLAGLVSPIIHRGHLAQALLTFGLALIGTDLLIARFGAHDLPVTLPAQIDGPIGILGHQYPRYRLLFLGLAAVVAAALAVLVRRTRAGALVRAAVDDRDMLASMGIDPVRVRFAVVISAGGLAGLAGALGAPILGPGPGTAQTVLLLSLVVVVLGGLGSISGALVAAVAVGEVQSVGVTVAPQLAPFLLFAAMAVVLAGRARRGTAMGRFG